MSADRDKLMATLAIISGDKPLSQWGQAVMDQRTRVAAQPRKTSIGNGFILDPTTGEVVRDPGYAAYEKERDAIEAAARDRMQGQMLERLGVGADLRARQPRYSLEDTEGGAVPVQYNPLAEGGVGTGPKVSIQRPVTPERLSLEARSLYDELGKKKGVVSTPKDILTTDVLPKVPVVGSAVSRATREALYSPEQLSVQTRGARFEQNLSNLAAGLALTGYELEQRNRWSPFVSGISQEEAQRRLENIERDFGARRDAALDANRSNTGGPRNTRRIGGKTYVQVGPDEWEEQ
jgi:hypothetical protein